VIIITKTPATKLPMLFDEKANILIDSNMKTISSFTRFFYIIQADCFNTGYLTVNYLSSNSAVC
ncbi:hypothetical protein LAV69_21515, partial [Klebsiella quasipneumoniae subsp. quasipneumoniae]